MIPWGAMTKGATVKRKVSHLVKSLSLVLPRVFPLHVYSLQDDSFGEESFHLIAVESPLLLTMGQPSLEEGQEIVIRHSTVVNV